MAKVTLQAPAALAAMPDATGLPSKVTAMPDSLAAKPEPLTVTAVPGAPLARFVDRFVRTWDVDVGYGVETFPDSIVGDCVTGVGIMLGIGLEFVLDEGDVGVGVVGCC